MATKKVVKPKNKNVEKMAIAITELQRLRKMNYWLAGVFAAQAIAVVVFGGTKTVPIVGQYLTVDQLGSEAAGHQVLAVAMRHLLDIRLTVLAAVFLAVFSLVSLIMATVGREWYEAQLQRGSNVFRWLGFALANGVMLVALALEGGMYEVAILLSIFIFAALGVGLEPVVEKVKRESKSSILPRALGGAALAAAAVPWVVFTLGALGAALWGGHISSNVYIMYVTTFVLFACWAMGGYFYITKRGRWIDTVYAEKMYMFLGLAVATVLAWQIFAGAF
jgi:hypothetical protein